MVLNLEIPNREEWISWEDEGRNWEEWINWEDEGIIQSFRKQYYRIIEIKWLKKY